MIEQVRKVIRRTPDGAFALVLDTSSIRRRPRDRIRRASSTCSVRRASRTSPIDVETAEGRRFADCAASVQRVLEDTLVEIARALRQETELAGSLPRRRRGAQRRGQRPDPRRVGLRARVRARLRPVMPGCALGAALYADRIYFKQPRPRRARPSVLGPNGRRRGSWRSRRREDGQSRRGTGRRRRSSSGSPTISPPAASSRWMDGASEFGPRALGHRSLLAAPHSREMRDRLNRDIKRREEFRPFAPVTPIETADRYFELPPGGARLARFMSGVFPVRPEWRGDAGCRHARRRLGPAPGARARHGAAVARAAPGVRPAQRRAGAAQHVAQCGGEPIVNRGLEGYSTFRRCGDRRARGGAVRGHEACIAQPPQRRTPHDHETRQDAPASRSCSRAPAGRPPI